jgi:hypothetical protein
VELRRALREGAGQPAAELVGQAERVAPTVQSDERVGGAPQGSSLG